MELNTSVWNRFSPVTPSLVGTVGWLAPVLAYRTVWTNFTRFYLADDMYSYNTYALLAGPTWPFLRLASISRLPANTVDDRQKTVFTSYLSRLVSLTFGFLIGVV